MTGELEPLYVAARKVLLDALEAIEPHLGALVLVGAQAVYLHTGEADLGIAPYTTDGDIAIDPSRLGSVPLLEVSMEQAGFRLAEGAVGIWQGHMEVEGVERSVQVDLLVPESLGGPGRRAARIPPHGNRSARKVAGLEGALVDRDLHLIEALNPSDTRQLELLVAGPAALLVAKIYKIMDRESQVDRRSDKDALDVYRLLRVVPTEDLSQRFRGLLADPLSRQGAETAQSLLPQLFGSTNAIGTQMTTRAVQPLESGETIAASIAALTQDLLDSLH